MTATENLPSNPGSEFARRVFAVAGIYGILILAPQYFIEARVGEDFPPPITHPENYYGFIGVALAWQVAFLVISRDPPRYRLIMIPAITEKVAFGVACIVLFSQGRLPSLILVFGCIDLVFACLFALSYRATREL